MELLITIFTAKLFFFLMKYHFDQVVEIKALNRFLESLRLLLLDLEYSPVYGAPGGSLRKCVVLWDTVWKITDQEHTALHCSMSATLFLKIALPSLATTTASIWDLSKPWNWTTDFRKLYKENEPFAYVNNPVPFLFLEKHCTHNSFTRILLNHVPT